MAGDGGGVGEGRDLVDDDAETGVVVGRLGEVGRVRPVQPGRRRLPQRAEQAGQGFALLGPPGKPLAPGRLPAGAGLRYARWDFQTQVLPI